MTHRTVARTARICLSAAVLAALPTIAQAQNVSEPAMLQWFEGSWKTLEKRSSDLFMNGYGSVWTPPPGRATEGQSAGYDVFDRFDLGKPGDAAFYGTEGYYKALVKQLQRTGADVFVDDILNHCGTRDTNTVDGSNRFAPNPNNANQPHAGGYPGMYMGTAGNVNGDFHANPPDGTEPLVIQERISGLIDIDHRTNNQFVRNPIPGNPQNLPAGTVFVFGRMSNVPDAANTRFYPDTSLPGQNFTDPRTGGNYTVHPFNSASPSSGDAVAESATQYLMRYQRWMLQEIGVDGFRIDAAKHMTTSFMDNYDRSVFKQAGRVNLDGSSRNPYSFVEVLDGNRSLVQSYIRKDITSATTVGGNRDALDFPLFFAMGTNLSNNGLVNDWRNMKNASQDIQDDGLANNGSQGIAFVRSHDNFGAYLDETAHAFVLLRPGRALVYTNAHEFGTAAQRPFPKEGSLEALGGFYGDALTKLVNIRNTHGRGNYSDRTPTANAKENLIYERQGSAIIGLSNRGDNGVDTLTNIQTAFAPGTVLLELSGNSANGTVDPTNLIPDTVTVDGSGRITLAIPRVRNTSGTEHKKSYVIYGLPTPQGSFSLSNVSQTLAGGTPSAANNGTQLLASASVITANNFTATLNTNAITLPGGFRDLSADGSSAFVRIDGGVDLNNSGTVDFRTPSSTKYGFESFSVNNPGFSQPSGNGSYSISIDTSQLSEGYHYLTGRAFRQRSDGGPDIFQDVKKVIYVDRLAPIGVIDSTPSTGSNNREVRIRSTDQTATQVFSFLNLGAAVSDATILGMTGSPSAQIDRDLFSATYSNVPNGNNAVTVVTKEITGNYSIQRIPAVNMNTTRGRGLGDTNFDGFFTSSDVLGPATSMRTVLYSQNASFNAGADLDANGLIDNRDLWMLPAIYEAANAATALSFARTEVRRRGDMNQNGVYDAADIDFLYTKFADTGWLFDLDVDGWPTPSGADQQDVDVLVRTAFSSEYGDTNLDGVIDFDDYVNIDNGFNNGLAGWANGDFDGNGGIDFDDYVIIDSYFNQQGLSIVAALNWLEGEDRSPHAGSYGPGSGFTEPGVEMVARHFEQFGLAYANAFYASVPEPTGLLAIGAIAVLGMRHQRVR